MCVRCSIGVYSIVVVVEGVVVMVKGVVIGSSFVV